MGAQVVADTSWTYFKLSTTEDIDAVVFLLGFRSSKNIDTRVVSVDATLTAMEANMYD